MNVRRLYITETALSLVTCTIALVISTTINNALLSMLILYKSLSVSCISSEEGYDQGLRLD